MDMFPNLNRSLKLVNLKQLSVFAKKKGDSLL